MEYIRVKGGKRLLMKILEEYQRQVAEYNSKLRDGLRLKFVHYVTVNGKRYVYFGKYYYKVKRVGKRIKWIYVGKELKEVPPPPPNPFDGLKVKVDGDDIIVEREIYERYLRKYVESAKASR